MRNAAVATPVLTVSTRHYENALGEHLLRGLLTDFVFVLIRVLRADLPVILPSGFLALPTTIQNLNSAISFGENHSSDLDRICALLI